jgi:mutator protein MutT
MTDPDYLPVTAAVIEKDGKILIARRKTFFPGHPWEFPGGKLEDGETLEECLKREIREELGIEIAVGSLISSRKHVLNCQSAIMLYAYQAEYLSGNITLTDHDEIAWVPPEDLEVYAFPNPDREIVKDILKTGMSD